MEFVSGGRRRIDKVLDDSFLVGLAELSVEGIRGRRNLARQEESDLSYLRRMLQGRIEVLQLELSEFDHSSDENLVDRLTEVLASVVGTAPENARITRNPSVSGQERRYSERLLNDLGSLDSKEGTVDGVAGILDRLREEERSVSDFRARVQDVVDALTVELGERYKSGGVTLPA